MLSRFHLILERHGQTNRIDEDLGSLHLTK